ncbi:phage tail tape measure protein [Yersinia enterocolitica]|uniref:phage tail tape measure protein n=1 Tax=Yersinia enterocolitica TaxID=630 RepID=UPI0021E8377F|nr:phage tail tape measure protein [Yersinia enterocolitica]EKN3500121.1 phage tail tape measure protein [Yersinia enterocolitica]EKN3850432.1 phage tail tape measure protein [Yersinia enterocolitica]EKN4060859.1 phage tail tape measure protein [Yersinia enterocolitica]EKN4862541.1 phage tail tape measure protein [Yersinia enterocolitica]EKN5935805.1 phage tail tape measure protein [Yersinia enterocolitica]
MADSFQLKALITGVDKLSPALGRIQKNMRSFRRNIDKSSAGAMPLAAGLVAGLAGAGVAYAKQEDAATGLKVAMMDAGGSVGIEFEKINKLAVGLGNKLPGTTADFQNMMQMLVRQGIPATNILSGVGEASAYLAVQLKKTPEAAAEFAAKMQDATGTASNDMMGLFDTIQKAFYMGVDDTNMLAFFGKTSSVLKMVNKDGLTAAKALAPISVMMDQMGMQGEASGNALRKVFQAGFDGKKMNAANKLLGKKGIKLDFTDGKGEFGGLDNMFNQLQKLQSLTTKQKTTIIKQIFGDDAETLQVVDALITKGKTGYDEVLQRMNKQATLQQRVDAQLGTLTNLWEAMTGTAVNGLAAIGGAFAGDTKHVVTWLGDLAERFSDFAATNPEVIRGTIGLAAGFVVLKLSMLGVNIALGLISKTIGMSPIGMIIRIVAMGAGLILANWGTLGPWFKNMWDSITGWFSTAWEFIKECSATGWQFVKDLFFNYHPLGIIIENWEPIVGWFKDMWERVSVYIEPILNAMNKVKGWANDGWDYVFGDDNSGQPATQGLSPQSNNYLLSSQSQQKVNGEMTVKFENAPPDMNVVSSQSSQSGFGIGYDVGYSRFANK